MDLAPIIKDKFNVDCVERKVSIHEVIQADKEDRLVEMFGASTHCPLLNIDRVVYRDTTMKLAGNGDKHLAQKDFTRALDKCLVNLMTGPTSHPWVTALE